MKVGQVVLIELLDEMGVELDSGLNVRFLAIQIIPIVWRQSDRHLAASHSLDYCLHNLNVNNYNINYIQYEQESLAIIGCTTFIVLDNGSTLGKLLCAEDVAST